MRVRPIVLVLIVAQIVIPTAILLARWSDPDVGKPAVGVADAHDLLG